MEEHGDAQFPSADHQVVDGRSHCILLICADSVQLPCICTSAPSPRLLNVGGGEDDHGEGVTMAAECAFAHVTTYHSID